MKIFKFGGASVKDAAAIRNLATILQSYRQDELVVVISAIGKTTNALEEVVRTYFSGEKAMWKHIETIKSEHFAIIDALFPDPESPVRNEVNDLFERLADSVSVPPSLNYDYEYDQVVSFGELLSTHIVSAYLNENGFPCRWMDARGCIRTEDTWRKAVIDYELSEELTKETVDFQEEKCYLTQGFIGSTTSNLTTTLGREGSDFTAAIFGHLLNAESVTIWKDVPGILNADPQYFDATLKLDRLTYREAVELTYYGAKVIHPKTMKPLFEKNIPLYVRSFLQAGEIGTVIGGEIHPDEQTPIFVLKRNQVLLTISPKDFSFMGEASIGHIYSMLAGYQMEVNMVQQSALSLSVAVTKPDHDFETLVDELEEDFDVRYNNGLELLTIRNYTDAEITRHTSGRRIFVEQRSRRTARFLVKLVVL
ncbi:aspartate kinase [Prolixibacter sp. SD074]|uniref:aspartate kinase n=1 Tax=Prolixibacter sp. SD074 TaxID=2652391 RepID=UPI001298FE3E|nr:aspartate kinase [Prolixibacter sp. SD074]